MESGEKHIGSQPDHRSRFAHVSRPTLNPVILLPCQNDLENNTMRAMFLQVSIEGVFPSAFPERHVQQNQQTEDPGI